MSIIINNLKNRKNKKNFFDLNNNSNDTVNSKRKINLSMSTNILKDCKNLGNSFLQPNYSIKKNNLIYNDIMKININEILYGKRKIRDLSNSKKKKINKSNSQIINYNYRIINSSFPRSSSSLNNSLCELNVLKKELNRYSNLLIKKKKTFYKEKFYKSVIDENKEKNKLNFEKINKAKSLFLEFKKGNLSNKGNKKSIFNNISNLGKKQKLNLSKIKMIIQKNKGFLDKLKRSNCIENYYPKNEIEEYSNGFMISS